MARGKDNLETLSVTVDPTGTVAGARAVNSAMRQMRRQIEAELEAIRRSFATTGRGGQGTVGSYSDIDDTRVRVRQSYNFPAEERDRQQRLKATTRLLDARDYGRQAVSAGYGKYNPGLQAAVAAAQSALGPSASLKEIQDAASGLESFWSPRGQRRALNRGTAINQQEAKIEKLHRQLDKVEKEQPALAGTSRFGYVRGRLREAERLLHGGGPNAVEESLHELSGVIEKHTGIISKSTELTRKENEEKKKGLGSYLNSFSVTSAVAALGASGTRVLSNYATGGITTVGQAPFEMMEGGGKGLSYMGRSKIISAGSTEGGMFGKGALGGWGMFLGGMAMEAIGSTVGALMKRGAENADQATQRAGGTNLALGRLLQGHQGFAGVDYTNLVRSDYTRLAGPRGLGDKDVRARMAMSTPTVNNAFFSLSQENEIRMNRNMEQMKKWRQVIGLPYEGDDGKKHGLAGAGYAMSQEEIATAMNELGGAGVDVTRMLGGRAEGIRDAIGFGRRALVSTQTTAKYLGSIGRGYAASGSADVMDPFRFLTGAAHHTGLRGSGADAFLQEMVAMQQRGEAGGISTNWSDQARFVSSLAGGGISGAGLGKLPGAFMDTGLSARQKFTAGGKELMEGLAIVQAAQRSDGSPSGMMRALEELTPEDRMQMISGMDPELQAIMFGGSGLGSKDIDAVRKRTKDGGFSPELVERSAYGLLEDAASAEADHTRYERATNEIAAVRGFTRSLDDAASALDKFRRRVVGIVVDD